MTSVAVRMYDVGFGDCFLVTVRDDDGSVWRMLVDCGAHMHSKTRPIAESVAAIVADLACDDPDGQPHVDVIVATHRHADHISGFAEEAWEQVRVDEVWLPFVEDLADPVTAEMRGDLDRGPELLQKLIGRLSEGMNAGAWPAKLSLAQSFALNAGGNKTAMDRLLGRNGLGFANRPEVRYLPSRDPRENVISPGPSGAAVHVLGPPRDKAFLRRMEPPKAARWLRLTLEAGDAASTQQPLFNAAYSAAKLPRSHASLIAARGGLRLDQIQNLDEVLAAASVLEHALNNTSLFFVLQVGHTRLLFPGDAQQGAWDHVLADPASLALVSDVDFYKIGHHGSHNATPRRYVEQFLGDDAYLMLPWGLVKRWQDTIPKKELLDALAARGHRVLRADAPLPASDEIEHDPSGLWTEVRFLDA